MNAATLSSQILVVTEIHKRIAILTTLCFLALS